MVRCAKKPKKERTPERYKTLDIRLVAAHCGCFSNSRVYPPPPTVTACYGFDLIKVFATAFDGHHVI